MMIGLANVFARARLRKTDLIENISNVKNIQLIKPVGYHWILNFIKHAKIIFTDSGGMQKEAF